MTNLQDLLKQRRDLDARIAQRKGEAVATIVALMRDVGVTLEELGAAIGTTPTGQPRRPVKYRDDAGNTWTGIGQRPRWLQKALAAGASLESFAVRKGG